MVVSVLKVVMVSMVLCPSDSSDVGVLEVMSLFWRSACGGGGVVLVVVVASY
jgi:hypothetical protein